MVGLAETDSGDAEAFIWLPEPAYGLPAGMTSIATGVADINGDLSVNVLDLIDVLLAFGAECATAG